MPIRRLIVLIANKIINGKCASTTQESAQDWIIIPSPKDRLKDEGTDISDTGADYGNDSTHTGLWSSISSLQSRDRDVIFAGRALAFNEAVTHGAKLDNVEQDKSDDDLKSELDRLPAAELIATAGAMFRSVNDIPRVFELLEAQFPPTTAIPAKEDKSTMITASHEPR